MFFRPSSVKKKKMLPLLHPYFGVIHTTPKWMVLFTSNEVIIHSNASVVPDLGVEAPLSWCLCPFVISHHSSNSFFYLLAQEFQVYLTFGTS